jgi:hypothetical protein
MIAAIVAFTVAAATSGAPLLTVESSPARPFVERTAGGIAIDGDMIARNAGDEAFELVGVSLDALDSAGQLIQRRELNMDGVSPSILTIPDRSLPPHGALLVYDPFPEFAASLGVRRLRYTVEFKDRASADQSEAQVEIVPVEPPPSAFGLPLKGARVLVWDGHDFYSHHRRWNYLHPVLVKNGYKGNAGRYAYDFIVVDSRGRRSVGDESVNKNWLSFGREVHATSAGDVVAVHGDAPDDRTFKRVPGDPNAVFGNYVVVKHADGTFSMFGHLMHDSPTVHVGQHVMEGEVIGRVGASGDALFPHLHYQRTLQPNDLGEGVPVSWRGAQRAIGDRRLPLPNGFIDTGDIVIAK